MELTALKLSSAGRIMAISSLEGRKEEESIKQLEYEAVQMSGFHAEGWEKKFRCPTPRMNGRNTMSPMNLTLNSPRTYGYPKAGRRIGIDPETTQAPRNELVAVLMRLKDSGRMGRMVVLERGLFQNKRGA